MHKMAPKKTSTLNLRIDPGVKEAVRVAALRGRRGVANLIELLILHHGAAEGMDIPEQSGLSGVSENG